MQAGRCRIALEKYRAALIRGERAEESDEVIVALQLEGLSHGHDLRFADEVRK